jgi:glycosyltransferase involved in cell wall biosynthesis
VRVGVSVVIFFIQMKISLFTTSLNRGGAERVFVNLANYWTAQGHQVQYVLFSQAGGLLEELNAGVEVVDLGQTRPQLPLRLAYIWAFKNYLKAERPDVVYSTLTYVTVTALIAGKIANYKGQMVVRQANSIANQAKVSIPVRLWNWFGYHVCYRWADSILVNSSNSRDEMVAMLPRLKDRVRLIYNPVMVPESLRRQNAKNEMPVVLASGRFAVQKDYATLLRAFRLVRDETMCRLVILGDGPLRSEMEAQIKELKLSEDVELLGYVNDTLSYYLSADLFVLTSKWEGFPNVLAEALAEGLPVVVTDSKGASREMVEPVLPDRIAAVGDDETIAAMICKTLRSPADSVAIQEHVRSNYSMAAIADQYLKLATSTH